MTGITTAFAQPPGYRAVMTATYARSGPRKGIQPGKYATTT